LVASEKNPPSVAHYSRGETTLISLFSLIGDSLSGLYSYTTTIKGIS